MSITIAPMEGEMSVSMTTVITNAPGRLGTIVRSPGAITNSANRVPRNTTSALYVTVT